MRKHSIVSVPFVGVLLCAQAANAQSIEEICKLGAQEPSLVTYSVALPARNEAFLSAFNAIYPDIKVENLRMTSGQTATRYSSEREAGVINADVVVVADSVFVEEGARRGWFSDFDNSALPSLAAIDAKFFKNGIGVAGIQPAGIIYNSDIVGADGIQSWEDILKPEFRGQLALANPRTVPSNMAVYKLLREEYGDEFFASLTEQQPAVLDSALPGTQQVAAGGLAIVLPAAEAGITALKEEGAPIAFAAPAPVTGYEYIAVVSEGSDSPNAARCLYNYLFSEEGQTVYVGEAGVSVIGAPNTMAMPERYSSPNVGAITDDEKNEIARLLNIQ